jgi:hypothetical protein
MRAFTLILIALLAGCAKATIVRGDDTVFYSGTSAGADRLLTTMDEQPYALASDAVARGMPATVSTRSASTSVGYQSYAPGVYSSGGSGGYTGRGGVIVVGPNGEVPMVPTSSLPVLGIPVTSSTLPMLSAEKRFDPDIDCPDNPRTRTYEEQVACNSQSGVWRDGAIQRLAQ